MSQVEKTSLSQFENASMDEKAPVQHVTPEFVDVDAEIAKGADLDVAAEALKGESLVFTEEELRRVRNKIDWRIMPLAAWATGMQFVDKSGLGAAATYGMRTSLKLVGQDYSWCVTIFYFGYFAGAFVSPRILQRFHTGKVLGIAYVLWSATLLGMLGVKGYHSVLALRFLLGVLESSFAPGMLLITTMWYTKEEQPLRFGIWNAMNGLLPIPFLLIYYGIGHSHTDLVPWRLIFLVIGLVSFVTGVVLFFFMPDTPVSVSWLDHREKAIAVERVAAGQTGIKNSHFKREQVIEALCDPRVWIIALLMFTSQAIGNVTTNFLGIVISGFGFTPIKTQLLQIPNSAVQTVSNLVLMGLPTLFVAFRNRKNILMVGSMSIALAGAAILFSVTPHPNNKGLRLAGCIMLAASGGNYGMTMAVLGTNIAGFTKKSTATSLCFLFYCMINIITPQTFLGRESPRYHTGLGFCMGLSAAFIGLCFLMTFLMVAENRRRDKLALTDPAYATGEDNTDLLSGLRDQTDVTNKHLRYSP